MGNPISWILAKLFGLFSNLDTETKEKIVDIIVEAFQKKFRSYFQQKRAEEALENADDQEASSGNAAYNAGSGGVK